MMEVSLTKFSDLCTLHIYGHGRNFFWASTRLHWRGPPKEMEVRLDNAFRVARSSMKMLVGFSLLNSGLGQTQNEKIQTHFTTANL